MEEAVRYVNGSWAEVMPAYRGQADLVVCDPIYESLDLSWVPVAADCLAPGGSLWCFADFHAVAQTKLALDEVLAFANWCIWPNDWGGRPRNRYGQKHDDILFYTKPGAPHYFDRRAVAVPKKMVSKTFNPSGRADKIPASVWEDLAGFSTTSAERIRSGGRSVRWQKPEKLMERIICGSCPPGGLVLDFFGGVATTAAVCLRAGRRCVSTEIDPRVHALGQARLDAQSRDEKSPGPAG